ncbi:MAG TPA: hypothetical protein DCS07_17280 [Bdellovibrionales bacterium]|nr:MAG: hypothetical protein A2Z97_02445 [Bdellovibrionales bacterium GWB1_52_6]OFZ02510.1 MAG: hypothetical protein A2X97_07565 [Bdellovibrionales bacterium GWA1_52_35]OFZ40327.1 MAG: hypothetical protein A2070_11650 [Bdellovibrionales bacterium GWC1_52_8]HAR44354.1 hypothetical protein [Bdellovibrionales bacterium]HCM41356.1 hypothetical protein [Bdellovibrionales bacterium]
MTLANILYRVLLVEEDPKQSELYADLIREVANCTVDVISRTDDSLDWIARSNYHLVVLDPPLGSPLTAPNGLALLEQIKRISPVTSVIVISERATVEQAVTAIRMGAEDYLKKPVKLETFQLAIKRGLDRKEVFGENSGISSLINLLNSCQLISASLELSKIFSIVQSYFARELDCAYSAIYAIAEDQSVATRVATPLKTGEQGRAMEEVLDIAVQGNRIMDAVSDHSSVYQFIEKNQLSPRLFIFRFQCAGPRKYALVCLSPETPPSLEAFEGRIGMLRTQIELTGKNIDQYMGVHRLVYVDDATGLYNTRYLNYILEREITQAEGQKRSFAVLFIDADHFKKINDGHGHLVGTKILFELGAVLRRLVRDSDIVFRYGGDEFVAVLSPCDLITAKTVAERIRATVEKQIFLEEDKLNLRFTVSIGVALFPDHASSKQAIIDAADHAMYSSKRATRNAVTIAEAPTGAPAEKKMH